MAWLNIKLTMYCNKLTSEVLAQLKTAPNGLSSDEAASRLLQHGENALAATKKQKFLNKFLTQLVNPMILLLLGAGVISLFMGMFDHGGISEVFEAAVIFFIVLVNAMVGVVQEGKAERALESLAKMSEPFCKVYRDGAITKIKTTKLVVGDVVVLEAGDIVPADGRILKCVLLKTEESALTGESEPVRKTADVISKNKPAIGDQKNMVFAGSIVAYGRCEFVVTSIGMKTQMGHIASLLSGDKKEQTQLQKKLNSIGHFITIAVLVIAIVVFIAMACMGNIRTAFMTAIVLAVAAIPEGLPAVITIVMAMGVGKLSRKNAIIRRLTAVETLGCTQIICSDKTGTLTLNKMTVKEVCGDEKRILNCMVFCTDCKQSKNENGKISFVGDPTETALADYAAMHGLNKTMLEKNNPRVSEVPFDSMRKMMSVVVNTGVSFTVFAKGGVDEILSKCTHIYENDKCVPLTAAHTQTILNKCATMANDALRVLGYAVKEMKTAASEPPEENMIFAGMSGMIDPPRPEVASSIKTCQQAGIKVIMITGDHKNTAVAVARKIGVLRDDNAVLTGKELDLMSDEEFLRNISKITVYARVSPENKVRIVKTYKKIGKVVAMTGDGVNDAPSLKHAHIGIGMGINGTDVAKNAADMVLADDNFATITTAVTEGRKIYSNIQKAISFLLSCNLCEVLSLFFVVMYALFTGHGKIVFLAPSALLWVNLVTDTFPALALGNCEPDHDLMRLPPRDSHKSFFKSKLGMDILVAGIIQTAIVLTVFFTGLRVYGNAAASTMTLVTLNFIQLFHAFNVQAHESIFKTNPLKNRPLIYAFLLGAALTLGVVYIPVLSTLFGCVSINGAALATALSSALAIVPAFELYKFIFAASRHNK